MKSSLSITVTGHKGLQQMEYAGERLLLTLWVGSLWAIGYVAVPAAFATLDTPVAAEFAALLFFVVNVIGQISGSLLIISKLFIDRFQVGRNWRFWLLCLMVFITLVFSFYIQPQMAEIRAVDGWRGITALSEDFDRLHMLSENLFLLLSVLGLMLVLTTDKRFSRPQ